MDAICSRFALEQANDVFAAVRACMDERSLEVAPCGKGHDQTKLAVDGPYGLLRRLHVHSCKTW